jgi:Tfp pilus assembly protein PilZ
METDNRHHSRTQVRWPVVIQTITGLVDGTTENLSLSGAFIRLSKQLSYSDEIPLVLKAKGRNIPCSVEVVWSDESEVADQSKSPGIGVRFIQMMLHDREFLHREILNRT